MNNSATQTIPRDDRTQVPAQASGQEPEIQVRVTNLNKIFNRRRGAGVHVLKDVNLDIAKGELLVLLGPSGCGKSTLLRCLVGLEHPTSGSVQLDDKTVVDADRGVYVSPNDRDVSMVFQNYALWPHMKVNKNVAYPLKARKKKDLLEAGRVEEVLRVVQCDHLADRYPPELSGGQQQRVSLARALAPNPSLLLLDEPLSNLDALLRIELRAQLRHLHRTLKFTGVHVTHDQEEALALATRVAVMNAGRIEQIGRPDEVYSAPATEYVADFLGFRNKFSLDVRGGEASVDAHQTRGMVASDLPDGNYTLRARPAHTRLRAPGAEGTPNTVYYARTEINEVLPGVSSTEYVVELDGKHQFIDVPGKIQFRRGDAVEIGVDLDLTHCYDERTHRVEDWSSV
jgi:iron(III) transport system ATP-binding protein